MAIDEDKLNDFVGRFIDDLGAACAAPLVAIGDKLGLYQALAHGGPLTAAELAERTGTVERYVREWLFTQAAAGYAVFDGVARFSLTEEQAFCLADPESPAYLAGGSLVAVAVNKDSELLEEAFRTGEGIPWGAHHHDLFAGVEKFFRPGYSASLVAEWLPALEGVEAKLSSGARVADVGCGHGSSTILLAQAFPRAEVTGFDYHGPSIEVARKRAAEAGVADRVTFEVATAQDFPGTGYDLVCFFDCLHDLADPEGAMAHVRSVLDPDGTWLLVEPMATESPEEMFNPLGRTFYACSTAVCLPCGLAGVPGAGLGNQVPDSTWAALSAKHGFTRFRRATETPTNRVYEIRP
jgi:2-polyprenyl-3-methyl-5-hydroxy-6-metoxy-1,4-benzoquinol methylase